MQFLLSISWFSQGVYAEENSDVNPELSLHDLMNLTVKTATKTATKVSEAPAIINVITADDIKNWGYLSVGEALSQVPGIYDVFDQVSHNLGVRGINGGFRSNSRIMKVMINSQPISNRVDTNNLLGPELIPMQMIDRIEVVRGPASAVYGANAFLGVVNIITKSKEMTPAQIHAYAGALKTKQGGGLEILSNYGGEQWDLLIGVNGSKYDRSGLELPESSPFYANYDKIESENDLSAPRSAYLNFKLDVTDSTKVELDGHYSKLDSYAEFLDYGTLSHINRIVQENYYSRLSVDQTMGPVNIKLYAAAASGQPIKDEERLSAFRNETSASAETTHPVRDVSYQGVDQGIEIRYAITEKDFFTVGADQIRNKQNLMTVYSKNLSDDSLTASSGVQERKVITNTGVFAQYTGKPLASMGGAVEGLGLTLNVRNDKNSEYEAKTTYRVGIVNELNESIYLKLLHGTSFKAPAAGQLYAQPLYAGEIIGNPDLEPETAATTELQVGYKVSKNIFSNISFFLTEVKDKVELVPFGNNQRPENRGLQTSYGSELETAAVFSEHKITWMLGFQNTTNVTEDPFRGDLESPSNSYPAITTQLSYLYYISKSIIPGLQLRHVTERRASISNITENKLKPYALEAYTLVNLVYNHKFSGDKQWLNLKVNNLLDTAYAEPGYAGVDVPGIKREFIASYHLVL